MKGLRSCPTMVKTCQKYSAQKRRLGFVPLSLISLWPQPARNQFNNVIFDNFSYICKKNHCFTSLLWAKTFKFNYFIRLTFLCVTFFWFYLRLIDCLSLKSLNYSPLVFKLTWLRLGLSKLYFLSLSFRNCRFEKKKFIFFS